MTTYLRTRLISAAAVVALAIAVPALAGPPLLCHPFEIGTARSLPWNGTEAWWQGRADYKLDNLIADTEALLTPSTPVIVRMETLRRAALYASADENIASQLLNRLMSRAEAAEKAGHPNGLALLDAAYVAGAFREITMLSATAEFSGRVAGVRAALGGTDPYALITRSVAARPDDAGIQFAAALISADKNRSAYAGHAAKARAGAAHDPLLARNIDKVS
jgi:hypothetical protein